MGRRLFAINEATGKRELDKFDSKHSKYILDWNEFKKVYDNKFTVYRIIYKDGSKGGWLENYKNLSQRGLCKVLDEAKVFYGGEVSDNAVVKGEAEVLLKGKVSGNAEVSGEAHIANAKVYGYAKVEGEAEITSEASVYGKAKVSGSAGVASKSKIFDEAEISGNGYVTQSSQVFGYAHISGDARITNGTKVDYDVDTGTIRK